MSCGPTNAMSQLSKDVFIETKKQELISMEPGPSRLYQPNQNFQDDFFQQKSIVEQGNFHRSFHPVEGLLLEPQLNHQQHWAQEFQHDGQSSTNDFIEHQEVFENAAEFQNSVTNVARPVQQISKVPTATTSFQPFRPINYVQPQVYHEMNASFMTARNAIPIQNESHWADEFKSAEKRAQAEEQQKEDTTIDANTSAGALAQTAGLITDILQKTGNEKYKNSKFFGLMADIRDKKVALEGDKLVEQIQPAQSAHQEAKVFLNQVPIGNWEEEFSMQEPLTTSNAPPRNWRQEFQDDEFAAKYSPDVSHDMDWSRQFRAAQNVEQDSVVEKQLYEDDWVAQFRENMALKATEEHEEMWNRMANTYDAPFSHQTTEFRYSFTQNNPYVHLSAEILRSAQVHTNLSESILASEALLQKEGGSAQEWYELGKKQQENENESAAIAALQKSIATDPSYLPAYLSLAVSQTNENLTNEAYKSIREWLNRNPAYQNIRNEQKNIRTASDYHEGLISDLLQAVMSRQTHGVDHDVQTALGILFNISSEYEKAIDCFQSALSVQPEDYQLWNKLGATLANSGDSEKAMDAYFHALEINPSYIRARYNLAIACMQLGHHQEAAGYLLGALSIQEKSLHHVMQKSTPELLPEMRQIQSEQSNSVWNALRLLLNTYMGRDDLVRAVEAKDLSVFRDEFEF